MAVQIPAGTVEPSLATYLGPYSALFSGTPKEGQTQGGYTYDGTRWVPSAEYVKKQSAMKLGEKQRSFLKQVNEIALPKLQSEKARDGEYLSQWNNLYLDSKNRLQEIIADSGSYSAEVRALAGEKLKSLESSYKTGSATAYAALGKKPSDKDTPTIGQLAVYAKSLQPPDTKAILQENVDAMKAVLGEAANLELQYAPQLAQVTGQAQREQMIKNIQAATDTPEISALRSKGTLTPTEQQTLAQYDAQFANIPTAELAARADTLFNQAIQRGKLGQYQELMPQYQEQYLEQMPGAEQTLQSLGQLGTQMAQRATERPELTAFEQQVAGPQLQSDLGTIDQNLVNQYMGAIPGVAEASQRLGQQINLDLSLGRQLTPEQERLATQAAREAYAARGMALGPQAITSEVLNREELANQRYRERQAAAQQAMGTISNLYQPALAQTYARQAGAEQYELGAQGQQFGQALARGEAESNRLQAANTLQSNAAQIAASTLGTQQQALAPAMAAYFNVPPTQAAYGTSANQAQNQYAQAGLNIANPTNPVITGLNMMPYQNIMSQYGNQANFAASYLQGRASAPSGGGGGGLCCFIMLEARYGNGVMDEVVRRYRDEHVTQRNRRGYYKLAEVFVPLMRKSKLFKFAVSKLFADPLVSFAKWHYGQNRHGWVFKPVEGFWMNVFDLLGEDVPFIRENGEVV